MDYNAFGFVLLSVLALAAATAVAQSPRLALEVRRLLLPAVALRIVGSLARYEVLYRVYGGVGDATGYYMTGVTYSSYLYRLDLTLFDPSWWWGGRWWGTQFVRWVSGFVVSVIGPTMRGEFLVFSLLAFAGLCLFGLAFHRAYPHWPVHRYLFWLWLWPSLWFWPSSVGKDSLLILALGLVAAGYVGRQEKVHWGLLISGLFLATAIRPHVAGATVLVLAAAQWLGVGRVRLNALRLAQGVLLVLLALLVLRLSFSQLGLAEADVEGVQAFVERQAFLTQRGGSQIVGPGGGWGQVPLAYVNILLRPFLWEAHNPQALVAALEVLLFWGVLWKRRHRIWVVVRRYARSDRYLRAALPLAAVYVLMLGLAFSNLGIIARQRAVIFPLLFVIFEALPREYVLSLRRLAAQAQARSRARKDRPPPRPRRMPAPLKEKPT